MIYLFIKADEYYTTKGLQQTILMLSIKQKDDCYSNISNITQKNPTKSNSTILTDDFTTIFLCEFPEQVSVIRIEIF